MTAFNELATKKARTAHIRNMLGTNKAWALRGLVRIFENQTADEQSMEATVMHNGIGFTGADAEILSSFAKQVLSKRFKGSEKQMAILFKKMPKYAKQLEGVAS